MITVEAAKQGGKLGGDMVSGLRFVHDYVGISGTTGGSQTHMETALKFTKE